NEGTGKEATSHNSQTRIRLSSESVKGFGIDYQNLAPNKLGIRGKDTIPVDPPDEYPWMAALMDRYGHFCGGSLIHNRHILTAARCVLNKTSTFPPKRELYVRLGEYDFLDKTRKERNILVERIIIHEDYK
ncbi:hypothetical protein QYM36_001897, partial [Artemia franciscana]